jgi:hypothetical protein
MPRPRPPFPHHTSNRRTMNALMCAGSTRVPLPETGSKGRPPHRKPPLSSRVSTTNESDGAAMDELPPRLCPAPKSATPRWATPERCNNGFAIVYRPWDGVNGLSNGCQRFDLDAIDLGDALTSFSATTVAGDRNEGRICHRAPLRALDNRHRHDPPIRSHFLVEVQTDGMAPTFTSSFASQQAKLCPAAKTGLPQAFTNVHRLWG